MIGPCVLVIDDDPSIRALYTTLLRGEGYRVETAIDGQDGLNQLGCAPDLILLDLMMPFRDGNEFLRRLWRLAKHTHTGTRPERQLAPTMTTCTAAGIQDRILCAVDANRQT